MSLTPLDQMDDIALMLLVRQSDSEGAFTILVERYQKVLLNFFYRQGVIQDGEDLVQQTFVRLYNYRHRYVATAKFQTFLFLIARQVAIDEFRRCARERTRRDALAEAPREEFAPAAAPSAGVGGDVDLQAALASLPEPLRAVVELGVYQDLPYAQIAQILQIPQGTVKSRMFNALARLREYLENPPAQ